MRELSNWKHSVEPYAGKHQVLAVVTCPGCQKEWILSGKIHIVNFDGTVVPSVVCPCDGCGFHEFVRLANWTYPDWFIAKTAVNFIVDVQRTSENPNDPTNT